MNAEPLIPRRKFLRNASLAGMMTTVPSIASLAATSDLPSGVREETVPASQDAPPQHSIKFAVCGISHDHIYGMIEAIQRGGGELVKAWGRNRTSWPRSRSAIPTSGLRRRRTRSSMIHRFSLCSARRSPMSARRSAFAAMKAGKDFLSRQAGHHHAGGACSRCARRSPRPGGSTPSCTPSGWK